MKLVYVLIGLVLAVVLFIAMGSAFAGPKECPPGQEGNCNTYKQKQTGKIGCFPDNAKPEGWIFLHAGCDEEKKKDPTSTPLPVITFESSTPEPIFGSPTPKPGSKITVIATKWSNSDPKTPTPPTMAVLIENENCEDSCLCAIADQLEISNDLQRTQIAINLQACTKP